VGSSVTIRSKLTIPSNLVWVGLLLAITLTIDLAQYLYRSAAFGLYGRYVENHPKQFDGTLPLWFNRPTIVCFIAKAASLAVAYVSLAWILADRIQ
jgi:hypothetical protein